MSPRNRKKETDAVYRKPRNPNRRRAIHEARRAMSPAMHRAMSACVLARETGLIVLSVHAINGPAIRAADPDQPSIIVNWRL